MSLEGDTAMMYAKRLLPIFLTSGMAVALAAPVRVAGADPLVRLNASQTADFGGALASLAEQGHVAVVAEGVPLRPYLSPQDAVKVTASASLTEEMEAVADAYDYSVQRVGDVFVLRKRYLDPDDLPALSQAECENALTVMPRVAEPFNPHGLSHHIQFLAPPSPHLRRDQVQIVHPLVDAFAASLTPSQRAMMDQKKLLVSSLSKEQQEMARQLRFSLYIQEPMDSMARLLPLLEQAEQKAVFCWQDTYSFRHVFGYTLPQQQGNRTRLRFHPLSHSTGWEDLDTRPLA